MSTSYADVLNLADKNARKTAKELDAERRKREELKRLQEKSRPVDDTAIKQILERRRREQEQQKLAEKQRLKQINELRKQRQTQLSIQNSTKKQPQKPLSTSKPPPPPPKPSVIPKKPAPNIPYEDLMRYASLKANKQPIPKELEHVADSLRANKSDSTKKPPPSSSNKIPPRPTSSSNNSKQPVRPSSASSSSSSSRLSTTQNHRTIIEQKSNRNPSTQNTSQRPSQSNGQKASQSMNRSTTNGQRPSSQSNGQRSSQLMNRSMTNGQRPSSQSNSQRSSQSLSRSSTNGQISTSQSKINLQPTNRPRPVLSNGQRPAINGQRSSLPPSRKRPAPDTDDEDDGADLDDFIVDDDDDDNGSDYRRELHDTLRTNFRFDIDRYRRRVIEEDDDDLRHMESSYAQIEKEEDYSARVGLQEDIDDIIREQAEKKRLSQMKKRPKPAS